jgi:glycolate oxidase FAD binding subunit
MSAPAADASAAIAARVADACAARQPIRIRGAGTRAFAGRAVTAAETLETGMHRGVVSYQPSELVLTARCGTPLAEIETLLESHAQMLAFEPPCVGVASTLGGAIATGASGPRRVYAGAARDFVLGVRCVNGRGELLRFGGQVMKNVAGYDVSRLMTGAFGTLGVLLDVSLKVLPRPQCELTSTFQCEAEQAIRWLNRWAARPLPLSASSWQDGLLRVRLSGVEAAVRAALRHIGGEASDEDAAYWRALRDQKLAFFQRGGRLWRIVVPPASAPLPLAGEMLIEWGGAQRWLWSYAESAEIRRVIVRMGGHATLCRGAIAGDEPFHPLVPEVEALHRRIKQAFDPAGILNPGCLYAGF